MIQEIWANANEPIAAPVRKSPAISSQFTLKVCGTAENCKKKTIKAPYFTGSFKVIDVDMTKKLVTRACCDKQHIHAYLQLFSP